MKDQPMQDYRVTCEIMLRGKIVPTVDDVRVQAIDAVTAERAVYVAAAEYGHRVLLIKGVHRVH